MKRLLESMLQKGETYEQFMEWAYGSMYVNFTSSIQYMREWNVRHGDKYWLKPDNRPVDDVKFMVKLWRDER